MPVILQPEFKLGEFVSRPFGAQRYRFMLLRRIQLCERRPMPIVVLAVGVAMRPWPKLATTLAATSHGENLHGRPHQKCAKRMMLAAAAPNAMNSRAKRPALTA
jgi:hypothetical protein